MPRPRFRLLPHTADFRLAAWGDDEIELIANAIAGVLALALGRQARGTVASWADVDPWPEDPPNRLVRAINEALFHLYLHRMATLAFELRDGKARLGLAPLAASTEVDVEIKAATFHALAPTRRGGRLRAILTLDL